MGYAHRVNEPRVNSFDYYLHKVRWVVREFEQEEGFNYHETFATVVKPNPTKPCLQLPQPLTEK